MGSINKGFSVLLILMIAVSILIVAKPLSAHSNQLDAFSTVSSQPPTLEWNKTFDFNYGEFGAAGQGDFKQALIQASDGAYVVLGQSGGYYSQVEVHLAKVDSTGNNLWEQTYGSLAYAGGVVQTRDTGYAIAGNSNYDSGLTLVKTNSAGNVSWQKNYTISFLDGNSASALAFASSNDNGFIIAGSCSGALKDSSTPIMTNGFLIKTDSSGNLQWNKTYGGAANDYFNSVVQTSDGGYAAAGISTSFGAGGKDAWLVKTDSSGKLLWSRTYGYSGDDEANAVIQTTDGGLAIAGFTDSVGAGGTDTWLIKTDSAGNVQWNKTYGEAADESANAIIQTNDGGYAFAGSAYLPSESATDMWLVKLDSSGNTQWDLKFGGSNTPPGLPPFIGYPPDSDLAYSLLETKDGGFALSGLNNKESDYHGVGAYYLLKLSSVLPSPASTPSPLPSNPLSPAPPPVFAVPTVTINVDGSIDPSTAHIKHQGNIYTLTENVREALVVKKSDITVNGADNALLGSGEIEGTNILISLLGIDLVGVSNVTIENLQISDFQEGISMDGIAGNTISQNTIVNCGTGIFVAGRNSANIVASNKILNDSRSGIFLNGADGNLIAGNVFANGAGLFLLSDASFTTIAANNFTDVEIFATAYNNVSNTVIYFNNFVNPNIEPFNGTRDFWYKGSVGNYWSNYKGTDTNHDGIGDTPQVITSNVPDNVPDMVDKYPLMKPVSNEQAGALTQKLEQTWFSQHPPSQNFGTLTLLEIAIVGILAGIIITISALALLTRRRRTNTHRKVTDA